MANSNVAGWSAIATSEGIMSGGIAAAIPFNPIYANRHPAIQLVAANRPLSTNNCLIRRLRVAPIEARIAITDKWDVPGHSIEFREAAGSDHGRQAMIFAAKSLAMTAVDLLAEPDNLKRARVVFDDDVRKAKRTR